MIKIDVISGSLGNQENSYDKKFYICFNPQLEKSSCGCF